MASRDLPALVWVLCVSSAAAASEEVPCPKGGRIDQSGLRCFWLSETRLCWSEARDACREIWGGDLAAAEGSGTQSFIYHSFPMKDSVWVWIGGPGAEGPQRVGALGKEGPRRLGDGAEGQGLCNQMALGRPAQRRRAGCVGEFLFLCERKLIVSLPSVDSYLTGVVLMTGVYAKVLLPALPTLPDARQFTVETLLFPGLWFSHAGTLVSVEMVVQPSALPSLSRVQILRPYCSPSQHLVPPGCSSLLNPFSCCSAVALCNTTGGCSLGRYWCHLLEACLPVTSPCSPYDHPPTTGGLSYSLPPRYAAISPFYHLVADLPLRTDPIPEMTTIALVLPERKITVYPDDILAVQHTRETGNFLHCLDSKSSLDSPWRQSYLSLRGAEQGGWWEGGVVFPTQGGRWVDGVVCNLRVLYADTVHRESPGPNAEHTDDDVVGFPSKEKPSGPEIKTPTIASAPPLSPIAGLEVIYPEPDEEEKQVHVQINVPTLIVVRIRSGQGASSSWSAPVKQTGIPFLSFCPGELTQSWPACHRDSYDIRFSSVTLVMPSVGVQTLNISAMNLVSSQRASVKVWGHEAVRGLSVEPRGQRRMVTGVSQSFTAKVESGSSVKFTWVIDNLEIFTYEGESYSVVFKNPAMYKLKVTAANPVSSQVLEILLTADAMAPLADPEFLSNGEAVAVTDALLYSLRVKVDISLGVTFRWSFGDETSQVSHTHPAACQTMEGLVERGETQVYVQDSVSHAYLSPGDFTLQVHVSNRYDGIEAVTVVKVRPPLVHLLLSSSPLVALVARPLVLEAHLQPSSYGASYTWDFGDSSGTVRVFHSGVSHSFGSAGVYNVTARADNGFNALTAWLAVEVAEEVTGLTLRYNGPNELNSVTEIRGQVKTGTGVVWDFDFGDGSTQRQSQDHSACHVYDSPGNYTVVVSASNSVSQAYQSIEVEVYRLGIGGIMPIECIAIGRDAQFSAMVNGNASTLTYHWDFGDGSPLTVVMGKPTAVHTFSGVGIYNMNVTAVSSVSSVSHHVGVCVQAPISGVTLQPSQSAAAVGQPVCFSALVSPEQIGYQFTWSSSSSGHSADTEGAQRCLVYKEEGTKEVLVLVKNRVSSKTAQATVAIQRPVSQLHMAHNGQSDTLTVNTMTLFWIDSCSGTNVSALWDFGDSSPIGQSLNVSHAFTSAGQFTVTATVFNAVSRDSVTLKVNVLLSVSDLTIHTNQPYAVVNEETVVTAKSSSIGSTVYYWTVDGMMVANQGTYQLRYVFTTPGVYQVRVLVQNPVSKREASILIEAFVRIGGLHIQCQNLTHLKYLPTRERVQCIASLTQGSNVIFHWLALQSGTKQQSTGDRELFQLLVEAPGNVSVQVKASNRLGETTSHVSLVAVEPVMDASLTTPSDIVAAGKPLNISVTVATGSNLQYLWYVNSDLLPMKSDVPFFRHTFTSLGCRVVTVSVRNIFSHVNISKQIIVQEEVGNLDVQIDRKPLPFHVNRSTTVLLHGIIHTGSDLHWEWEIWSTAEPTAFKGYSQSFNYSFTNEGVYKVSVNVSNGISWQRVSHSVTVQDAVSGLTLKVSKAYVCTEDPVVFTPVVSSGTNVSFNIEFGKEDRTHGRSLFKRSFTTSSLPVGEHLVRVKAWNQVSSSEVTSLIVVSDRIRGLHLVGCCSNSLESLKETTFKVQVQSGFLVSFTWTFHLEGLEPSHATGEEVVFSAPGSGQVSISVVASNGVCSQTLNETAIAEWPLKEVKLSCQSATILTGYTVGFAAEVNGGTNFTFHWDFGDSTEVLATDNNLADHIYHISGGYIVTVKVFNNVSRVSAQLYVKVVELRCSGPQASLVQKHSTIRRSRPSYFEAIVDMKDCSAYKAMYLWEVFRSSSCAEADENVRGNAVVLSRPVEVTSPLLSLPRQALEVGLYCMVFTVSLQGTPLQIQCKTDVTVVHASLVAVIKGGSHRLWPLLGDLVLDGSESHDPDDEPGVEHQLEYHWDFTVENSIEFEFPSQCIGRNTSKMTVPGSELHPGRVYIFTLTVRKGVRTPASTTQFVSVGNAERVFPVTVDCVSCSPLSSPSSSCHVSYSNPLVLSGHCEQCDDLAQYEWSAENDNGVALDLDEVTTSTGGRSPDLAVRPGILRDGWSYNFVLNVSQPARRQWGSAGLTILPNQPPYGGRCVLRPESDIRRLETVLTYHCPGWQDDSSDSSQLIYTFQVTLCRTRSTDCPPLILYRGTRSTFGTLVPIGSPGTEKNVSFITVTLSVEDQLGAKVIALNRTLQTFKHPGMAEDAGQWLKNKSQTELWVLVQHGNPQEIIPYSVALTSHLNQMQADGGSNVDPRDMREIRGNVTRALASLPLSTFHSVDQVSSALTQSTAVTGEGVWCEDCQEKVLEAVGKMINVIEERKSVNVPSAANVGRNILSVIDNTLIAASSSVETSGSIPAHTNALRSASRTALSALDYAGALMRSLMRSRVQGEEPLSLSAPHISTFGFHGKASNLLCTQTIGRKPASLLHFGGPETIHPPCRFHIPPSLTAHLKNQSSEVVQILLGLDVGWRSNPFLSSADPPISTAVAAMEFSTPQGRHIPISDLEPEQAIRVTLPNKRPPAWGGSGSVGAEGGVGEGIPCTLAALPAEGRLNFTVQAVDDLDDKAGLFISFNFSLAPGALPGSSGQVWVEVSAVPDDPGAAPHDSLVRELTLSLTSQNDSVEETFFLSPLLKGKGKSLFVSVKPSLEGGGPVRASLCVFSTLCRYYSVRDGCWSSDGVRPLEGSTLHTAHCLAQHLTMFGASLFVHPGAVVLGPPAGGPVRNVAVGIVCAVLVLLHLLLGLIAHKLDHLDSVRLSQVPLCGRPGVYQYRVLVKTGWRKGAGTTAHVGISLHGVTRSGSRHLHREGAFQRGGLDQFHLETDANLGEVWKICIWHDNTGLDPSWYVQHVVVWDPLTDQLFFFLVGDWLSVENERSGTVEREVLASCPEELSQFQRVLASQLLFCLTERHLWLSLWTHPAHSAFTRGQRVTCSALLLHLYLALGAAWYGAVGAEGHSGPISAHVLVSVEAVAVGMTVAALMFPLQCLLCFLFRKIPSQVALDVSVPPSPVCHSVEMEVYLGQSALSDPSFLSLPGSSSMAERDSSPSSLLGSKAFDSGILEFWSASGLAPGRAVGVHGRGEGLVGWRSRLSLAELPSSELTLDVTSDLALDGVEAPSRARLLRRKKALTQLRLASPSPAALALSPSSGFGVPMLRSSHQPPNPTSSLVRTAPFDPHKLYPHLTSTFLTQSEENLLRSIAADTAEVDVSASTSDSGRDSPRTTSSFSNTRSGSCSNWSDKPQLVPASSSSLYRCPSTLSLGSVASTFLPSPSPDPMRSPSVTRIGVARRPPGWALPPWALCVVYPLAAVVLAACLAVVGLYGSRFPRTVLLMWLVSALSAFLASALVLEPLKVFAQAVLNTALWRPVDAEVEDLLAQESTVRRVEVEQGNKVRPPCGFGLLQARAEARKVRALRSLMKHCVCQLLFLLLVLLVNYQGVLEDRQGRLLLSSVRRTLHQAPRGHANLTSLKGWWDAWQWMDHILVPHLHQNPALRLVGLPRLQRTHPLFALETVSLGNSSMATRHLLVELRTADQAKAQFETLLVHFTHYHRESALFVCVSVRLEWVQAQRVVPSLSIHPLFIPPSSSGPDLQLALSVLLLTSAFLFLGWELWALAAERSQYLRQGLRLLQLCQAFLSLATAILQLNFLQQASSCARQLRSRPEDFLDLHSVAALAAKSSQLAALLLTLLVLKLLGTLRFVRRWVLIGRVLRSAWKELSAGTALLLLLLLACAHTGHMLFFMSADDFGSVRQAGISALSLLRGRLVLRRLCRAHPVLGPLYGMLLTGGGLWLLARLCGAVLIRTYRLVQVEMYRPAMEPQDYEMVEFFIKRLKLWMGLSKAKEFRHRVKFEGMDAPPSRSSRVSCLSTITPSISLSPSPRSSSSALSMRSDDSSSLEPGSDIQHHLDQLLPCVNTLLARFDCVNQLMDDLCDLEIRLEETQSRAKESRRRNGMNNRQQEIPGGRTRSREQGGEAGGSGGSVRTRKIGLVNPHRPRIFLPSSFSANPPTLQSTPSAPLLPCSRCSYSESSGLQTHLSEAVLDQGPFPARIPGIGSFPRRRAWHSGSSHSADAALRAPGGAAGCGDGGNSGGLTTKSRPRSEEGIRRHFNNGAPVKRKAWISEGSENQD